MIEATSLKAVGVTVTSEFVVPVYRKRLQINRTHRRASVPASWYLVRDWIVEAAGRSHSDHTWGKWIHFRQADGCNLGMHLEHQEFGRYSF